MTWIQRFWVRDYIRESLWAPTWEGCVHLAVNEARQFGKKSVQVDRRHETVQTALASGSPPLAKEGQGGFAAVCSTRDVPKSPSIPLFQRGRPVHRRKPTGSEGGELSRLLVFRPRPGRPRGGGRGGRPIGGG